MENNATVDLINKVLIEKQGYHTSGKANFRVVFSDDCYENRFGTYDIYKGKMFIHTFTGIKEIPKYPHVDGRWIIERWAGPELTYHPDIVTSKDGDYVCIYVFQDVNFNYLPPLLKVAEIVVKNVLTIRSKSQALAEDLLLEEKADKEEVDKIFKTIRDNYENKATEPETLSISAFVEPSKDRIGVKK